MSKHEFLCTLLHNNRTIRNESQGPFLVDDISLHNLWLGFRVIFAPSSLFFDVLQLKPLLTL